jgi:hypothetical protein
MCNWRNTDHREGAHNVEAVRLGRGKGIIPYLFLHIRQDRKTTFICFYQLLTNYHYRLGEKKDEYNNTKQYENN